MRSSLLVVIGLLLAPQATTANEPAEYLRDIKPIFTRHCYRCHGPQKQEGGLRLDTGKLALAGSEQGPVIVAGKSAESSLIERINSADESERMPPEGAPLSEGQIALVRDWIDAGAIVPDEEAATSAAAHWSFQPLRASDVPAVKHGDWVRNPIDAFIVQQIEAKGLEPSQEADRATLIRRLSLDLLGLPPAPAEVHEFLTDSSPNAYERLVDRLLASPHYGERWGRHWLDLARYADSNGYTIDSGRTIWKYRDWVIQAINNDMPFDEFTIEQLAGDMLHDPTMDQRIATGFHRNTLVNEEGGTDPEQFRVEAVVDRVSTTGSVFLGLTVGCARCHDHKYDPISQREFYQLFALFNNADEPLLSVPTDQQSKELPALAAEIAQVEKRIADVEANASGRQAEWERKLAGRPLEIQWRVLEPIEIASSGGASIERLDDGSLLVRGDIPPHDTYRVTADIPCSGVTAVRLEVLTHDSLPRRGPGLAGNGNFVLDEIRFTTEQVDSTTSGPTPVPLRIDRATADHSQPKYGIDGAIDGRSDTGWAINLPSGNLNVDRMATFFVAADQVQLPRWTIDLEQQHASARYSIGRFRLSVTDTPRDILTLDNDARAILAVPVDQRTPEQKEQLHQAYLLIDQERVPLAKQLEELKARQKQLDAAVTTTLVMQERGKPRETFIHVRGDFLRHGEKVEGGVPAVLPPLGGSSGVPNRLDFARWLVDLGNPLTARVTVNRIWQQYFGQGLVATENDFGTQGAPPTHPELLDWLAAEFMRQDWSMKALHRLIVTSATYRQSSQYRADLVEADPLNQLLARQARLRLEAEVVRDSALQVAGLLSPEVGGPSVYPPQPEGIYRFTQQVKYWRESTGQDRYRRGMYTYFWRSSPYPFLVTFDAPDANVACTRRVRSNTPLQALTLANDRSWLEFAAGLAKRIVAEPLTDDAQRIRFAFRLCFARDCSEAELVRLAELLAVERVELERAQARQPVRADRSKPSEDVEIGAWTAVARVLLNLDEFVNRE